MYENAEQLLRDVDVAIEWLNKHRLFDRIRSGKLAYQRETDKDKKLDLVQVSCVKPGKNGLAYFRTWHKFTHDMRHVANLKK